MENTKDVISELTILKNSKDQYYIGRTIIYVKPDGSEVGPYPYSRESAEYWGNKRQALLALENQNYTVLKPRC